MDEQRAVIVTGAAGGLGAATTRQLHGRGVNVLAVDLDIGTLEAAIGLHDERIAYLSADVSNAAEVERIVTTTVERFGRIDALFNNAARHGPAAAIEDYSKEEFRRVLDVNVIGVWLLMKAALPELARQKGRIVNVSSIAGLIGWKNLSGYTAAKHAVVGLTRAIAIEAAGRDVAVNALCPGSMDTPMLWEGAKGLGVDMQTAGDMIASAIPRGTIGTPEEVAQAATWLLLDAPSFITGAAIPVDGGQTAT